MLLLLLSRCAVAADIAVAVPVEFAAVVVAAGAEVERAGEGEGRVVRKACQTKTYKRLIVGYRTVGKFITITPHNNENPAL